MAYNNPVDNESGFSFPHMELDILNFWKEHHIFAKTLEKTCQDPVYTFYDGPPFATGLPHHGHLLASTLKDIVPRYFTMNGHHVERRFGWDCHGLPIEHEIDKQYGQPTHEVIDEIGIAGYNQACRSIVQRYAQQWEQTITRLGRWVDFDNGYKTMDLPFMESVWWVFKQLWNKGLIYQGTKVVPFSTALGTGLSNFEAGSNYQQVQDPAITVLLSLTDSPHALAIWTTTPWTLPSNLGVCVNADIDYVLVEDESIARTFYLAKDRLEAYNNKNTLKVLEEVPGSALVGLRYEPLFSYFNDLAASGAFQVYADAYVTTEDGTGLVHMAPSFGEDDNRVMRAAGVTAEVCPIDNQGCFTEEVPDFAGCYVKEADKAIIKHLKDSKQLYAHQTIEHSYPFCPRSDTPLIYRTIPSWYVQVEKLKPQLLAANEQIQWVPDHLKYGRFGKWLENTRDWAISRNRVWGTPIPIWINDTTGATYCMGSIEELQRLTQSTITDLHRDHIDDLSFTLPDEQGTYHRITDVFDCWFESGAMPYAQQHYPFDNEATFADGFPADFIAEGLDQTRGWFYLLTVLSVALFDKPAFKNVIVNGIVTAEDGKKMSKRLKNYTAPDTLMETYGADALRLYLINSGLVKAEEQRFSDQGVKDMVRRTLLPWLNAFKFLHTYATVDHWQADLHHQPSGHILDRWIISRLQSLLQMIHTHMQAYRLYLVVPELLRFLDDLTNTYIRLNRARFWGEGLETDKCQAYTTLHHVIETFNTCMAPFAPFLAEHIHQQSAVFYSNTDNQVLSVHLRDYSKANSTLIDEPLEHAVDRLQQILLLGRQKRNDSKIKVKIPLSCLTIIHKDQALLDDIKALAPIIQKELNVKSIAYRTDEDHFITLYAKPNSPVLGKRLGKRFAPFRQKIEALNHTEIEQLENAGRIIIDDETFEPADVLIFREAKPGTQTLTNRLIAIELDTTLNQSLLDEGMARDIVNRIQKTRKDLNFNVDDRIDIDYECDEHLQQVIAQHNDYICQETLALKLADNSHEDMMAFDLDGHTLRLHITLASATTSR